jgi:hypothetical protein
MKKQKTKKKALPKKIFYRIRNILDKKRKSNLHTVEWLFILAAFFVICLPIFYFQVFGTFFEYYPQNTQTLIQNKEDEKLFTGEVISEPVDTTNWDTYQNKWYGFEIQHPDSWKNNTQYKTATEKSAVYETIYKFRKDDEENSIFVGYDIKIYKAKKVQKIESTNDIHIKDGAPEDASRCILPIEKIKFENEELELQKISIDENSPCYEPAYFYSIAKGDYIYNIVPAVGESGERFSDPEEETDKIFPEYKEAVKTLNFNSIVRPKPKRDPRAGVRKPISAKIVGGRLVCAVKNDKPKKSDNNKPGHLDLECCLDPDERPNPWCTY